MYNILSKHPTNIISWNIFQDFPTNSNVIIIVILECCLSARKAPAPIEKHYKSPAPIENYYKSPAPIENYYKTEGASVNSIRITPQLKRSQVAFLGVCCIITLSVFMYVFSL